MTAFEQLKSEYCHQNHQPQFKWLINWCTDIRREGKLKQ